MASNTRRSALERLYRRTASRKRETENKNSWGVSPFLFQPTKHQKHVQFLCSFRAVYQRQNKNNASNTKQKRHGNMRFLCNFSRETLDTSRLAVRSVRSRKHIYSVSRYVLCTKLFSVFVSVFRLVVLPPRFLLFLPLAAPLPSLLSFSLLPVTPNTCWRVFSFVSVSLLPQRRLLI